MIAMEKRHEQGLRLPYESPDTEALEIRYQDTILSNGQNTEIPDPEDEEYDL
jgi:hypothetical protein